ncbi:MAG: hypothetical protein J6B16_04370 [Clostridia bacterium]|nr:hypothetical protein [Clostridia bacterium]
MNKTKTPTVDKVTFPLRLPPKMYKQIREKVNEIKENENYAYSINDFLTEIIEKGLKENSNETRKEIL